MRSGKYYRRSLGEIKMLEENFTDFNRWVEQKYHIHLDDYKERQMQRRIKNIMDKNGANSLHEYEHLLDKDPIKRAEFIEHLTINVTEFYRNQEIFSNFEKCLLEKVAPQFNNLKLWSAACSTGAEPYTLAMILEKNHLMGNVLATDIDDDILKKARLGQYSTNELKNVSDTDVRRYFKSLGPDQYQIGPAVKQRVSFKKHDLLADQYESGFHAIICRNVTIYFKPMARDRVYQKISEALVPGGILFTGATETLNSAEKLGLKKIESFIYEKQGE